MAEIKGWTFHKKHLPRFALVVLCVVALYLLADHTLEWYMAWGEVRGFPAAEVTPQSISDTRMADLSDGTDFFAYGYKLRLPGQPKISERAVIGSYANGAFIHIMRPHNAPDLDEEESFPSRYQFAMTAMNSKPGDISFFHSNRANKRAASLLAYKIIAMEWNPTVICIVSGSHVKGFQIGDPNQNVWRFIDLQLFDEHNQKIEIMIRPGKTSEPPFSQAQINAIVASIQTAN
jgi:hypothetical protein